MADVPFGRCRFFWPIDQRFGCWPDTTAIAVPEQMATVRLGDFSPQIGFFASAAGSVGFAMFGSNAFFPAAPILLSRRSSPAAWHYWPHPGSSDYQALAAALPLMAGAVLVAGSLFRLGWIANLLSIPATIGFLARISVHIVASQIPAVLGLAGQSFLSKTVAHTAAILVAACTGKMMRNRTFARDNYCRQEIVVCGSRKRCTLRSSILRLCPHRLTVVPKLCLGRLAQASCDPL
jgi:hypothetical protein